MKRMPVTLGGNLTLGDIVRAAHGAEVSIAPHVADKVGAAREVVERAVASRLTVYGITTGIGDLANVRIDPAEARLLQRDIVRSHATAVGPSLPREVVRAMLLLKARTFAYGASGVRFEVLERLVSFLNAKIHPVVPEQGSLGASGDLALLAHLALPIMGEGLVEVHGAVQPSPEALRRARIEPLDLSYKEGLSLVNGTEAMLALGILTLDRAERAAHAADVTGAMTLEACLGTDQAFDARLIALRSHEGAKAVAANLRLLLADSQIVSSHRHSEHLVQDAYSLRCIPQVHGAYRGGFEYVRATLRAELASAVDNPSVIPEKEHVASSGNFHGEALGLAADHLALCVAGYATIAERRIARAVDAKLNNGLPAFLTPDPGRRSGFMLAHYTAASLTSEGRSLAHPASADSIPTSAGQEDHVSMGMTAARKAGAVLECTMRVIAVEALVAAQAIDLRGPLEPAPASAAVVRLIRTVSDFVTDDRPLAGDIEAVTERVSSGALQAAAEDVTGPLA
ncbi:histidine ammonia-lyase [soil metagenome]